MSNDAQHILIISSWFPTASQPFLGNFVEHNAHLLASEFKVTVLHVEMGKSSTKIDVRTRKEGKLNLVRALFPEGGKLLNRLRKEKAFKAGLDKIEHVDLVIGHVALPLGWMFMKAARYFECPLIYVEHGSYFRPEKLKSISLYQRKILRKLSREAVETIAVSERLKTDMQRLLSKEISVIGNHVDSTFFQPTDKKHQKEKQFLHISTLDEQTKNPRGIVDACQLLAAETTDFHLTIVSDEDVSAIQTYALNCGLEHQISFLGPFSWQEIAAFYARADAFVLFSDYETFSIVLAEAYSTGTPVISTPVGIAPETSDSTTIIVEKRNIEALKDAMLTVVNENHDFDSTALISLGSKYSSTSILNQWKLILQKHGR